jgi:hypothetical protein
LKEIVAIHHRAVRFGFWPEEGGLIRRVSNEPATG